MLLGMVLQLLRKKREQDGFSMAAILNLGLEGGGEMEYLSEVMILGVT